MAMLLILIENRHRVVSRDELMERVWDGVIVEESNIATNIARLRRALASEQDNNVNSDSRHYIETSSGYGYQFVAEVRELENETDRPEPEPAFTPIPLSEPRTFGLALNTPTAFLPKADVAAVPPALHTYWNWRYWLGFAVAIGLAVTIWFSFRPKPVFIDPAKAKHREVASWKDRFEDSPLLVNPSPDGRRIAYSKSENGESDIFIQEVGMRVPIRVTDGEWPDYDPIWSPDGQQIVYQSNRGNAIELAAVDLLTRQRKVLRTFERYYYLRLLRWSHSAHKIFYTDGKNVFAFFPETQQTINLTNFKEEKGGPHQFGLSLNEDKIAYIKILNGKRSLFVARLDGSQATQLVHAGEEPADPEWFPDNKHILYASRFGGSYQVSVIGLNDDRPMTLTAGSEAAYPHHLSRDGKLIFYTVNRGEGDLYRCDIKTRIESEVVLDTRLKIWPDVSTDGKTMAFQRLEPGFGILRSTIFTSSLGKDLLPVELVKDGFEPRWSPNSKRLAFMRENGDGYQLWLIEPHNAAPRLLTKEIVLQQGFIGPATQWHQPNNYSWSPDGSQLVFSARNSGITNLSAIGIDGQTKPARSQNADPALKLLSPLWSPDGTRILYLTQMAATGKAQRSLVVNDGARDQTIFRTELPLRLIGWQDDNHFLIGLMEPGKFMLGELTLKQFSLAGDETRAVIGQSLPIYLHSLRLSPDGKSLAFTARQNDCDNVWLYTLATRQLTQLTTNNEKHQHLTGLIWTPDGSGLCYGKQSTSTSIMALELFD